MANGVNKPYGLRPVRNGNGSPYCGEANLYHIPSADTTAYHIGTPVQLLGNGDATGVPSVIVGAGAAPTLGAIVGVHPVKPIEPSLLGTSLALEDTFVPATKTRDYYVMVSDDPDLIYQIQQDTTTLLATAISANADYVVTQPVNNAQYSAAVILGASVATTIGLNLKLLGTVQKVENPIGGAAQFADWLVRINNHSFRPGTVGIAV